MSDRREAVEAAIDNALARRVELDDDQQRDRLIAALADAALAAMDTEPTEAEVEAAAIHLYSTFAHDYEESEDVEGAWSEMTELRKRPWRYDGKCTLIAAREARPGGQG